MFSCSFILCPQVILFVNADGVDELHLQKLLSEGIEIEYRGRKVKNANLKTVSVIRNEKELSRA